MRLLEVNIGIYLCDLELGNGLLDITVNVQAIKEKKLDIFKIKHLCFKEHYQKSGDILQNRRFCKSYI